MRGKKLLFCLTYIMLFCAEVQGQKTMHVLLMEMPERTFLTNEWDKEARPLLRKTPSYSSAFGIMVRNQLKDRWHFNYGFLYSYQAQHFKMYFNNLNGHVGKTILSYIKLPLLIQYNVINGKNSSVFIQAGPQMSVLVIEEGAIVNHADIIEAGGGYKPIVFDGVVALGVEFKVYKNLYYNLQLRIDHSLNYVDNLSYQEISKTGTKNVRDVLGNPRSKEYNMTLGLLNALSFKVR